MRMRYDRRLTLVVAGAGFGKSTLLRQMTADALVNPLGVDVIVRCGPDDDDLSVFAAEIRRALGMHPGPLADVAAESRAIAGAMRALSPTDVCLVIDDFHRLSPKSVSFALVAGLLERLPATGHLVLLSRTKPELGVARELANGTALLLSERDLAFTEAEWTHAVRTEGGLEEGGRFERRGNDRQRFMPWPALAVLAASAHDPSIGVDYIWTEVLVSLRPEQRRLLALAAAVGGGDTEMLRAVAGDAADLTSLSEVPLVRAELGGWWPHDLWTEHLDVAFAGIIDRSERERAQSTAAAVHLDRGEYVAAFRLARAAGNETLWRRVVNEAFGVVPPRVGRDVIVRWATDLHESVPGSAEQLYLEGKRAAEERNFEQALTCFRQTCGIAEANGDLLAERNAIVDLALVGLSMDRTDVVASLFPRVEALAAAGLSEAISLRQMGRGLIDEISGNLEGALAHNRSVTQPAGTWIANMAHYNASRLLLLTGRFDEAAEEMDQIVDQAGDASLRANQNDLRTALLWARGDLEGADASLDLAAEFAERFGFRHRWVALLQKRGILEVLLGRPSSGRTLPTGHVDRLSDDERALEKALRSLNDGDNATALALVDGSVEMSSGANASRYRPLAEAARMVAGAALGRGEPLDETASRSSFPGEYRAAHEAARALAWLRSKESDATTEPKLPSLGIAARSPGLIRAGFVPALRAELAALAFATGDEDAANALVDGLGPVAVRHLAPLTSSPWPALARAATQLLAGLPNTPTTPIEICVLGGVEVSTGIDGHEQLAHLRRSRVKALLGYLATRPSVSRHTLLNDLWPELDERRALNNFRVTLAYLVAVLEPGRAKSLAPFTVRQTNATISLADDPMIRVDVRELFAAAASAQAAERRGDLEMAHAHHLRVVTLHRGEFLAEFAFEDWAVAVRDRLNGTVAASALSAAEFLVASAYPAEAEVYAAKALALDPFREAAHRVGIACRMLVGDRSGARRRFDALDAILGDLGVNAERATEILRTRMRA